MAISVFNSSEEIPVISDKPMKSESSLDYKLSIWVKMPQNLKSKDNILRSRKKWRARMDSDVDWKYDKVGYVEKGKSIYIWNV